MSCLTLTWQLSSVLNSPRAIQVELDNNLPAEWMKNPVSDRPNNWVQVTRKNGRYRAEVGREDFEDIITVELGTGKILEATMNNPLRTISRECSDAALLDCGPATAQEGRYRRIHLKQTDSVR